MMRRQKGQRGVLAACNRSSSRVHVTHMVCAHPAMLTNCCALSRHTPHTSPSASLLNELRPDVTRLLILLKRVSASSGHPEWLPAARPPRLLATGCSSACARENSPLSLELLPADAAGTVPGSAVCMAAAHGLLPVGWVLGAPAAPAALAWLTRVLPDGAQPGMSLSAAPGGTVSAGAAAGWPPTPYVRRCMRSRSMAVLICASSALSTRRAEGSRMVPRPSTRSMCTTDGSCVPMVKERVRCAARPPSSPTTFMAGCAAAAQLGSAGTVSAGPGSLCGLMRGVIASLTSLAL
mmetsp:Transcript_543/g.1465  ORF Transcript_543/g.1465 Transcript_543/m.1465 type:complete len:293 (-) Transcript_543:2247-3125(-)